MIPGEGIAYLYFTLQSIVKCGIMCSVAKYALSYPSDNPVEGVIRTSGPTTPRKVFLGLLLHIVLTTYRGHCPRKSVTLKKSVASKTMLIIVRQSLTFGMLNRHLQH